MTTSQTLSFFRPVRAVSAAAAGGLGTVAPGVALSLAHQSAMTLRVTEGQAWVTLGHGPDDRSSDVFLCGGQTLQVAAGQHVVVEAIGGRAVQFRWAPFSVADTRPVAWWRRASLGNGMPTHGESCYA
jgi:hypothetical protein